MKVMYSGVRYVARGEAAPESFKLPATCGTCGRTWDDGESTALTPAPGGRCPFEHTHAEAATSNKVTMQFNGHDIEGDAATLADINNKLTQHAAMLAALRVIATYPLDVDGYNSLPAVRLRFVAMQTRARDAIARVVGAQS